MWGNKIELTNATGYDVDLIEVLSFAPPSSYCHVIHLPPNSRILVPASFYCDRNRCSGRSSFIRVEFRSADAGKLLMPESFRKYSSMTFFAGRDGELEIEKLMKKSDTGLHSSNQSSPANDPRPNVQSAQLADAASKES